MKILHSIILYILISASLAFNLDEKRKDAYKARIKLDSNVSPEEIHNYLITLAKSYPNHVEYNRLGFSYEAREIALVRISSDLSVKKPAIFIDAGIHGREMVSVTTILYIIHQLAEVKENKHLFDDVEWHLLPLMNPDSYAVAINQMNAMHRKTVSKGVRYDGVDLDRNFDIKWGTSGTSNLEGSQIYCGARAFSEIESRIVRDYITDKNNTNIMAYISLRSYGTKIYYPYRYQTELPKNAETLHKIGEEFAASVFKVRKTHYEVGNGIELMYVASGVIADWMMDVAGIQIVFTIELPKDSFREKEEEVLNISIETFEGIQVFHNHLSKTNISSSPGISWLSILLILAVIATLIGALYYFKEPVFGLCRGSQSFA